MISIGLDYTLFIQLVQFLLIVFIVNKLIIKPIKSTVDARNEKINNLVKSAEDNLDSIRVSEEEYNKKLQEVRNTISEYRRKMKEEADAEANKIIQSATDEIAANKSKAISELQESCATARATLKNEVKDLATVIRTAVIGKVA